MRLRDIAAKIAELDDMEDKLKSVYDKQRSELRDRKKKIQSQCRHPLTERGTAECDPQCEICGATDLHPGGYTG